MQEIFDKALIVAGGAFFLLCVALLGSGVGFIISALIVGTRTLLAQ